MSQRFYRAIAKKIPDIASKLLRAGMDETPEHFVKKTLLSSFYLTMGFSVFLFGILAKTSFPKLMLLLILFFAFCMVFLYMLRVPDVKIMKERRLVDREIVFVARFLTIEIESGVTLYMAMRNVVHNYEAAGKYFKEIVDSVDVGTSLEDAMNQVIERSPSWNFRRILWQMLNVMQTGADISKSLNAVTEQIVREQAIEVSKYGKRLNPIAMFYMIMAVILPSLGITMLMLMASFMGLNLNMGFLFGIVAGLGFIQFMFVAIVRNSRPAVEL